jgi:hypothetical protein
VCLVGLVGCVALAVDIGLFAEARTELQDAVDAAVLAGCRQFDTVHPQNNAFTANTGAVDTAKTVAKANTVIGDPIKDSEITLLQVGVYRYNGSATPPGFETVWTAPAAGENYGALSMSAQRNQWTAFARVFGVNSQLIQVNNVIAVHRPRDIAIILDFSGSMSNGCQHNNSWNNTATIRNTSAMKSGSMDPNFPRFGPWSIFPVDDPQNPSGVQWLSAMQTTAMWTDNMYEYAPSNITYPTPNHGGPIVTDFVCQWQGTYGTMAWGWNVGGSSAPPAAPNVSPAVASYQPLDLSNPTVMPAPAEIANQEDPNWTNASGHEFGDKWPYMTTSPSNPPVPADYAKTVQDYVNFLSANPGLAPNINANGLAPITNPNSMFNDAGFTQKNAGQFWETYGYSLNKNNVFHGYTMGPGYFGKTFYMWPPDPRTPTNRTGGTETMPAAGQATSAVPSYVPGDWRQRFFVNNDNSLFWDTGGRWLGKGSQTGGGNPVGPQPDYNAVIKWILSGPQVFPPNLSCGRVLYYDQIPTTIPATGGGANEVFWRNYIDYVLGTGSFMEGNFLFSRNFSTSWTNPLTGTTLTYGTTKITALASLNNPANVMYQGQTITQSMNYADFPRMPRAHFWFGPLSMVAFMQEYSGGMDYLTGGFGSSSGMPGSCHEAQSWELKAAVQSALNDIKNNHPNDWTALIFFNTVSAYNQPRSPLGNDYAGAQLFLWYPFRIGGVPPSSYLSDPTQVIRPYNVSGSSLSNISWSGIVPVANGGTDYDMPLKVAFNQFSANPAASSQGGKGRIGANKLVIFESDGFVNNRAGGSFIANGPNQSYYSDDSSIVNISGVSNGDTTAAVGVVNNLRSAANGWGNQCKVHCIGFGDLLEPSAPAGSRNLAISSLTSLQAAGGTSNPMESYKIITGTYQNRITSLQNAFQRILQSGLQVSLAP